MQPTRSSPALLIIAVVVLLLPAAYPLSYLALFNPVLMPSGCSSRDPPVRCPNYRIGGHEARKFYRPLQEFDQWLRPNYWFPYGLEEIEPLGGGSCDINVEEISLEIDLAGGDNKMLLTTPTAPTDSAEEEASP